MHQYMVRERGHEAYQLGLGGSGLSASQYQTHNSRLTSIAAIQKHEFRQSSRLGRTGEPGCKGQAGVVQT